ncbi:hypothetical protein ACFQZC_02245 [Streptacidiphilus monticola]
MSVFMTLEVVGDAKALEKYAADNKEKMEAILEAAKRHGLVAHRFRGPPTAARSWCWTSGRTGRASRASSRSSSPPSCRSSKRRG